MNLTVLLIAAWLPLVPILLILMRSGSFGKGSVGTFLKLLFLGIAAAVPAFVMEAGALLLLSLLLGVFPETAFGGHLTLLAVVLRSFLAAALIEEGWKHFVLRVSTWEKMTMESVADGIAAAGVVSVGFSAVLYGFWQAGYLLIPADMAVLHAGMPEFLSAGPVLSFLFALLFIFSHFGFSGLMGALYGVAKGSEQKEHGRRAGMMRLLSWVTAVLIHGVCASLLGWGLLTGNVLWLILGFGSQTILALLMMSALSSARDAAGADSDGQEEQEVDFADSEEFAQFAESAGGLPEGGLSEGDPSGGDPAGGEPSGEDIHGAENSDEEIPLGDFRPAPESMQDPFVQNPSLQGDDPENDAPESNAAENHAPENNASENNAPGGVSPEEAPAEAASPSESHGSSPSFSGFTAADSSAFSPASDSFGEAPAGGLSDLEPPSGLEWDAGEPDTSEADPHRLVSEE